MNAIEIISGIVLIVAAIAITVLVLAQESQGRGLSGALTGGSSDMLGGRFNTNQAKVARLTKILAAVFAVICVVVTIITSRLG